MKKIVTREAITRECTPIKEEIVLEDVDSESQSQSEHDELARLILNTRTPRRKAGIHLPHKKYIVPEPT